MKRSRYFFSLAGTLIYVATTGLGLASSAQAEIQVGGVVLDLNGRPLAQAQVSLTTADSHAGADVITVFTDPGGKFSFPESISAVTAADLELKARVLGYEQLTVSTKAAEASDDAIDVTVIMRSTPNQATVAPASAWLTGMRFSVSHSIQESKGRQLISCCLGSSTRHGMGR